MVYRLSEENPNAAKTVFRYLRDCWFRIARVENGGNLSRRGRGEWSLQTLGMAIPNRIDWFRNRVAKRGQTLLPSAVLPRRPADGAEGLRWSGGAC